MIMDSFAPKWNEQYTWDVSNPCTMITIDVSDNCHLHGGDKAESAKDTRIGKVRVHISTLGTDRVYTHSYSLLVLRPSGVNKMGEIHLAVSQLSELDGRRKLDNLTIGPVLIVTTKLG
ncbi:protein QUIRKY [Artemisia annua]|uniref:Protein QUIRKY n=1 Tax=Artemisia annua TaxID=35608 RepID=A0A2U1LVN9_ARTAN|nr:protein QUIRKY [Artemisia annua]